MFCLRSTLGRFGNEHKLRSSCGELGAIQGSRSQSYSSKIRHQATSNDLRKVTFERKRCVRPHAAFQRFITVCEGISNSSLQNLDNQTKDDTVVDANLEARAPLENESGELKAAVEGGGGIFPPGSGGGEGDDGDESNGDGNEGYGNGRLESLLFALQSAWKQSGLLQKFFFGGLIANIGTHLTPAVRRNPPLKEPPSGEPINPFIDFYAAAGFTFFDKIRIALFSPLALWRASATLSILVSYLLALNALFLVVRDKGTRYKIAAPITRNYLCALASWTLGCRTTVQGQENLDNLVESSEPFVAVANHLGYLDLVALGTVLGPCSVVAKAGMQKIPLLAPFADCLGSIYVDRTLSAQGRTQLIIDRARTRGNEQCPLPPLLVFPEGTTTTGSGLLNFKSGAFAAGVPVLPVGLAFSTASGLAPGWAAPLKTPVHLWCLLCEVSLNIDVLVLPAHQPTPEEKRDAKLFARTVQHKMAAALNVPVLDQLDYRDGWKAWNKFNPNRKGQS